MLQPTCPPAQTCIFSLDYHKKKTRKPVNILICDKTATAVRLHVFLFLGNSIEQKLKIQITGTEIST